jgi:uncharacterized protein (TIGR00725 family)
LPELGATVKKTIVGIMGGGYASREAAETAYRLGALIAREGWVLLNGGRAAGVMEASARGARDQGGLTVGILPGSSIEGASGAIDIPILTGMGDARNCINVLTSDVVIACPGGAGTLSEVALALKNGRHVIALGFDVGGALAPWLERGLLRRAQTPEEAVAAVREILGLEQQPSNRGDGEDSP